MQHTCNKLTQHLTEQLQKPRCEPNAQVYDGISVSECACHGGATYTYTAGTLVGGLVELHMKTNKITSVVRKDNATTSDDFLSLALAIADSAIRFDRAT